VGVIKILCHRKYVGEMNSIFIIKSPNYILYDDNDNEMMNDNIVDDGLFDSLVTSIHWISGKL